MSKTTKAVQRVHGLANIAALLNRGDLPKAPEVAPKRERRDLSQIVGRTYEKITGAIDAPLNDAKRDLILHYMQAALREAYNTGHADALDQNGAVEALLEQQYDARTKLTMPAVAAGIMEQMNLPSMTLDLAMMATVFQRKKIDFSVSDQDVIEYTLIDNSEA